MCFMADSRFGGDEIAATLHSFACVLLQKRVQLDSPYTTNRITPTTFEFRRFSGRYVFSALFRYWTLCGGELARPVVCSMNAASNCFNVTKEGMSNSIAMYP